MKQWILGLCACLTLIYSLPVTGFAKELDLQLYAQSAVLMDGDSGRILLSKNGQEIRPMASTTKIMTCIVALEYAKKDDIITFSKEAVSQPKVHLGASKGESFLLQDLLHSLMLESHNDTAVAIAEGISGSVHDFTELMNAKASSLGCKNTHFVTPNGLDASDLGGTHATTAEDLARIMKYCIYDSDKKEEFIHITRESEYSFSNLKKTKTYSCHNHNAFLQMMTGALSGKTGFTVDAGYCYVGALKNDGRIFIVALLACGWPNHKSYKWSDTKKLMQYALDHFQYEKAILPRLVPVNVENGIGKDDNCYLPARVTLRYQENISNFRILKADDEDIITKVIVKENLKAPITEGEKVGTMEMRIGKQSIVKSDIITKTMIKQWNYGYAVWEVCTKLIKMLK